MLKEIEINMITIKNAEKKCIPKTVCPPKGIPFFKLKSQNINPINRISTIIPALETFTDT
jgi:hypothetical protein